MSGHPDPPLQRGLETVEELRERLGLFSFTDDRESHPFPLNMDAGPDLPVRPGTILEFVVTTPGAGAMTSALIVTARHLCRRGAWVVVDPAREFYSPGLSGWDVDPNRTLVVRPGTLRETCWSVEQCLRCPGVSATWAWVEGRLSATVSRRWKMAAEVGGGVGFLFRADEARREPAWADLRLRVTPLSGGQGDARRIKIDMLYRRGGLGGSAQVWEIDHAAGDVRLVPEVAHPKDSERAARA